MNTISDLIDAFVAVPLAINPDTSPLQSNAGFALDGIELIQRIPDESGSRTVAGWDIRNDPTDHRCWIRNDFSGLVKRRIVEKLTRSLYLPLPIAPVEDASDPGATVTWYAFPVECMSCGEPLESRQRSRGLCDDCHDLRVGNSPGEEVEAGGWVQTHGLHGAVMPTQGTTKRDRT